ncbi:hypothetical protein SAMN04489720_2204 [Agrococcus jejuensis]|uniref:SipW-cognate class signal peptide n=1 Tax=Agrococcus jejuensis TaxID=399736 RepID=A0A1G8EVB4_9MICO|nr:hypothetical protein SAMN04489720_2204 [Agrococcus jejuensis]
MLSASAAVALAAAGAFLAFGWAAPSMALQSMTDGSVTVCTPVHADGRVAIALPMVRNATNAEIVVTDAALVDPDAVRVVGFDLLPVAPPDVGYVGFPLDEVGLHPVFAPVTVAPGDEMVVAIALEPTSDAASRTEGVRLTYEVDGRLGTGSVDVMLAMETAPAGGVCGD